MSKTSQDRIRRLKQKAQERQADERAEAAREQHREFRRGYELQARRSRAAMTLGQRVDRGLLRASQLAGVSAASYERVSSGKASSSMPRSEGLLYSDGHGSVADVFARRVCLLVQALEREVDSHLVRPLVGELANETSDEKDARLLKDFEGLGPAEVSFLDPGMGSPEAVRRARRRLGRRPQDGSRVES